MRHAAIAVLVAWVAVFVRVPVRSATTSNPNVLPNTLHAVEYVIPTANSLPSSITAGPDGNVWFTEANGRKVGRVTPAGVITEFRPVRSNGAGYQGITLGPHNDIWFMIPSYFNLASLVVEMRTDGTVVRKTEVAFSNSGMLKGPDGNLWFDINSSGIGRMKPGGNTTYYPTTESTHLGSIGPDGNIWFTEIDSTPTSGLLGRITLAGVVTEFTPPHKLSDPFGIIGEPNGKLYFGDFFHDATGTIDATTGKIAVVGPVTACFVNVPPSHMWYWPFVQNEPEELESLNVFNGHVVDRFQFPSTQQACPIVLGPDGNLWFIDGLNNAIGVLKH